MALAEGTIARSDHPAAMQGGMQPPPMSPAMQAMVALIRSQNIATALSEEVRNEIGQRVCREAEIDDQSRKEWKARNDKAFKLAMQVAEAKTFPWPNAANVKYPLLTTAAIQFAARAYPAIIQGREVVKGQVRGTDDGMQEVDTRTGQPVMQIVAGPDGQPQQAPVWRIEPGAKQRRADRIGGHMSYQLTEEMEEWEPDTDKMLHILPIVGCAFRKTYYDAVPGRNCSDLVAAEDLIVNQNAKTLERAPRVTHRFSLFPHEIAERTTWLEIEYGKPRDGQSGDDDAPHHFYEQHRWLDLDGDKKREPYIVTVHCDTKRVVRIVARFDETGVKIDDASGEVLRIEPLHYFTLYPFIPAPDGSFYPIGLGWLLYPINEAVNSTLNRMLDAGTLQNTGGGFIGSGLRIKGGRRPMRPGEYLSVQATGGTIRENIVTLDHQGPSAVLFNLLGLLIEAGQDISSVKDVMTGGEGPANEAATRTLARIEQGMKVFSAIYKRIYRSMKSEYGKLYRLNGLYLDEGGYRDFHDDWQAVSRADYQAGDMDVVPVADPNVVTDMQRLGRAEFMMQFLPDPMVNGLEIRRRIFTAANLEDVDALLVTEPQPDPEVLARGAEIENEKNKTQIEGEKVLAEIAKMKSEIILNLAKAEAESDKAQIMALSTLLDDIMSQRKMQIEMRKADAQAQTADAR